MDPNLAIAGLAAIAAWFQVLFVEKRRLKRKEVRAIESICSAVDETKKYVRKTRPPIGRGKAKRSPEDEEHLANLWRASGDYLRDVDRSLAAIGRAAID